MPVLDARGPTARFCVRDRPRAGAEAVREAFTQVVRAPEMDRDRPAAANTISR